MSRAAATTDVYHAVAEPRRRAILDALATRECRVSDLVATLDLNQPTISKHLRVLREVGLVSVRDVGRERLYRANTPRLRVIHDWVSSFERTWTERFSRLDEVLNDVKETTREP